MVNQHEANHHLGEEFLSFLSNHPTSKSNPHLPVPYILGTSGRVSLPDILACLLGANGSNFFSGTGS